MINKEKSRKDIGSEKFMAAVENEQPRTQQVKSKKWLRSKATNPRRQLTLEVAGCGGSSRLPGFRRGDKEPSHWPERFP